ncbi:DNA adenine methylase [Methanothermococcus okinawensis]|uniref:site-specific DNA-methyltransferase (adenine-specific) n=1 Tax=Methanothermococcus okinawensis (strain DSM 14208 / JCM 11175 / IH1) TaxID=647113 RepID=F8ANP9_METOI|nr:DNA adenine methylase [Methanothermococcus okinawensis]AEH06247.1 DNA adenine methylase [Methanothermococcus okinawensis IH1]
MIKPFLKWAGGKTQIINSIDENLPKDLKDGKIKRYIEPFVGGGAVLFYILQKYELRDVVINDINSDLILTYKVVKNDVNNLINELSEIKDRFLSLSDENRKNFYYNIREEFNKSKEEMDDIKRASYFIVLNKTCYNGLYRVNKKGGFNVPYGMYKNPKIFDADNLKQISKLLKNVKILCGDFEIIEEYVDKDSFVYFDPPYKPINKTSSFTAYTKYNFSDSDQIRLSELYKKLDRRGAKLMLSNSYDIEFFRQLYSNYFIKKITAKRMINCKGDKRGNIYELLITNY